MRVGEKKWPDIGEDMAFGCVFGLQMPVEVPIYSVALCAGTCTNVKKSSICTPLPRS